MKRFAQYSLLIGLIVWGLVAFIVVAGDGTETMSLSDFLFGKLWGFINLGVVVYLFKLLARQNYDVK